MNKSNDTSEALFDEEVLLVEEDFHLSPTTTPPAAAKTSTTKSLFAELASAVDGGSRAKCVDSMPSQGLHVVFPNKVPSTLQVQFPGWVANNHLHSRFNGRMLKKHCKMLLA